MPDVTPITIDEFVKSGDAFFQITYTEWGNAVNGVNPGALETITLNRSFAGIAIAADSDIDSVAVQYPLPKPNTLETRPGLPFVDPIPDYTMLSVERPLLMNLRGGPIVIEPRTDFNLGGWNDTYTSLYLPQGALSGVTATFGSDLSTFIAPKLKLLVTNSVAALAALATKRTAKRWYYSDGIVGLTEVLLHAVPVHGRRKAHIRYRGLSGTAVHNVRTSVVSGTGAGTGTAVWLVERQVDPAFPGTVAIDCNAGTVQYVSVDLDGGSNYICVFSTRVGGGAGDRLLTEIVAVD